MAESKGKTKYRRVLEGRGGTIWFKKATSEDERNGYEDLDLVAHVGTYRLVVCVGVYFKLDAERAFVAHINAYKHCGGDVRVDVVNSNEGELLKQQVLSQLQSEASCNKWDADQVDKTSLLLACPEPQLPPYSAFPDFRDVDMKTGWWVTDAIREFLNLRQSEVVVNNVQGFVVNHKESTRFMVPYPAVGDPSLEVPPPELDGHDERTALGLMDWNFSIDPMEDD